MTRIALIAAALAVLAGCGDFESTERRAKLESAAANLDAAYESFGRCDFDSCITFCHVILSKYPDLTAARELAEDAAKMKEREKYGVLKRAHVREIAENLEAAFGRFDLHDFDGCIAYCKWILTKEPEFCVAVELVEGAEKVKRVEEYYGFLRAKVEYWKRLTSTDEEAAVPYVDTLAYPHLSGFK